MTGIRKRLFHASKNGERNLYVHFLHFCRQGRGGQLHRVFVTWSHFVSYLLFATNLHLQVTETCLLRPQWSPMGNPLPPRGGTLIVWARWPEDDSNFVISVLEGKRREVSSTFHELESQLSHLVIENLPKCQFLNTESIHVTVQAIVPTKCVSTFLSPICALGNWLFRIISRPSAQHTLLETCSPF